MYRGRYIGDFGDYIVPIVVVGSILLIVGLIGFFGIYVPLYTQDYVELTVNDKESYTTTHCSSSKSGTSCSTSLHMLVYTDGEILSFDDCIVLWILDSQTMYAHISPGKYRFKVYGYSVPWLKMYRSIISYEPV